MSKVEHMVCPACGRMHGQEHEPECPWNGLTGGVSPQPGASEAYRDEQIERVAAQMRADVERQLRENTE